LLHLPANYEIKVLIWHQGESDQKASEHYYDNLKAVVAYLRHYLVKKTGRQQYAHLPVVCGTYSLLSKARAQKVVDALERLAQEDANFYVVDASTLSIQRDKLHFDASGAAVLGKRYFDMMLQHGILDER
jgi:hypothetical protein